MGIETLRSFLDLRLARVGLVNLVPIYIVLRAVRPVHLYTGSGDGSIYDEFFISSVNVAYMYGGSRRGGVLWLTDSPRGSGWF